MAMNFASRSPNTRFSWKQIFRLRPARVLSLSAMFVGASLITGEPAIAQDIATKFSRSGSARVVHDQWTSLLKTYVKPASDGLNRVDYAAFKADGHAGLKAYLATLTATDVTTLSRTEQFAYWANLYNAKTIDIVLEHYPVASIRDIDISGFFNNGPWDKKVVSVNGTELSLNDIEHVILRGTFRDPRVHYAVNCASVGCPNLDTKAFSGATLDNHLNVLARAFVNSPRGFHVESNRITASKIYSWFQEDFGNSEAGVLRHALKYAEPALAAKIKSIADIRSFEYDWSLNDTKSLSN